MSATPSKLFAGFIGFIICVCLFSGVGKAEQIAETESHVVLEAGTKGILPCRIQRNAHLVQWTWWTRELTSEHHLVYLDPYSSIRRRGGPGYTEGLFNITEVYSLVIKDVKVQDEGLYICEVSDFQTGKVFRNKTRVSVRGTGASVTLEMGAGGILPCRIQKGAYEVKWKRQLSSDTSETELLVSLDQFFKVGERDGTGYEAGLFNITEEYSLVIKEVKVQDEGLYLCTIFDFKTGRVFRNSTRVFVQAFPEEPFPVIQECVGKDVNPGFCTLIVHTTSNLSCLVKGYYPDIDLFFLHGSQKVRSTGYEEWNNVDGTRNKNIRVQVSTSNEPYKCVASSLPGIVGNRSLSVVVRARDSPQTHSQGPNVAAIVVPVFVIVGICLPVAVIFKCYLGNGKGYGRSFMRVPWRTLVEGPVSKLELWKLVKMVKESHAVKKLRRVLRRLRQLSKTAASHLEKDDDFYESLCKWKRETASNSNQREDLYSVCNNEGMSDIIRTLEEYVWNASYDVSRADIDYILWGIGDPTKITELLKALGLDHGTVATARENGRREVIDMARNELLKWRSREFDINPVVILSLKLDELESEINFFKLPLSQKEEIDVEEMKDISCQIFEQHFESLLNAIRIHHGELEYRIRRYVEENNASLFDTVQMLKDWEQDEECSYYEKRIKLREAVKVALQRDHKDAKWPPDDELTVIASFLPPASMVQLCSKLGVKSPSEEASLDQEKRFQALIEWRDDHASSKDLMEKHNELFTALKEVERGGLVPRFKGPLVYKAELVDLAFHLFAQDLLPFTEALGITTAKLVVYRPTFQPSHMTQGTIGLVCKLFESGERCHLLNLLKEMPYPNVFASVMLALEVSFGEVCAVSNDPISRQNLNGLQSTFAKSKSMLRGDHNAFIGIIVNETSSVDKDRSSSPGSNSTHGDPTYNECVQQQPQNKVYNETTDDLETMQTSAVDEEDHDQVCSEFLTYLNQFKVWREQPRLTSFNFRQAVANCLGSVGCYEEVSNFLQGHYNEGNIPYTFIDNILHTMDPMQRSDLGNLIRVAPFNPVAARLSIFPIKEEKWSRLEEEVSRNLHAWVNEWILQITQTKWKKGEDGVLKIVQIAQMHKEFNDKLVENGFLELAREIMINERQLMDARGRPITVTDSGFL